jgi:RimJ/RimL family protein N-acetyltransferase
MNATATTAATAATAALLDALATGAACPRRGAERPYRETLALRGGSRVLLRPAHHRDAAALQRFFALLSPRSRLLRFHGALNRLPEAAARSMSTQVAARHVALVAVGDDGELCAEARYAVDGHHAEFGIAVADAQQGQGLGRALLLRLAVHARESGIHTLVGSVMPGNEPMLALLHALGAELRSQGAEVRGTLALRVAAMA